MRKFRIWFGSFMRSIALKAAYQGNLDRNIATI